MIALNRDWFQVTCSTTSGSYFSHASFNILQQKQKKIILFDIFTHCSYAYKFSDMSHVNFGVKKSLYEKILFTFIVQDNLTVDVTGSNLCKKTYKLSNNLRFHPYYVTHERKLCTTGGIIETINLHSSKSSVCLLKLFVKTRLLTYY